MHQGSQGTAISAILQQVVHHRDPGNLLGTRLLLPVASLGGRDTHTEVTGQERGISKQRLFTLSHTSIFTQTGGESANISA